MVSEQSEGATKGLRVINSVDPSVLKSKFFRLWTSYYIFAVAGNITQHSLVVNIKGAHCNACFILP